MQRKKQAIVERCVPPASAPARSAYNCPLYLHIPSHPASSCLPSPSRPTVAVSTRALAFTKSSPRAPRYTRSSYCEKMLRLNLARDEHAQKLPVFDASYSPDASSSSSSSSRSRSPEPRVAVARRTSLPRSNTISHPRCISHTLPRSHTHPADLSAHATFPTRRACNEEVLRSRLEGVLSSASNSRNVSPQRRRPRGDSLSFGLITPPHGPSLPPPPVTMARSRTSPAVSRASRPSTTSPSPITPPPSPPFDANRIALQLRDREGYVSFADVQGLGVPHDADEDDVDVERGRGRWWTLWKG